MDLEINNEICICTLNRRKRFIMWESSNVYQAGYYIKGHPEKCETELFFAETDKEAVEHVNEMDDSGKFVFELNKQVSMFKTIKEWKE